MSATEPPRDLPIAEFGFPGPLRDRLVAAILSGAKSTTTSLLADYENEAEPLPVVGKRSLVVDSSGAAVAVIEVQAVTVVRLGEVDAAHVEGEGEGDVSLASWRAAHERFWYSPEMRAVLGDEFRIDDDTAVVLERFAVVERIGGDAGPS
jgi:uncharacterized protein YhfF